MIIIVSLLVIIIAVAILLPVFGATDLHIHRQPQESEIRVACVGDSITNGALIPNCFSNSYPAKLQKLLGKGFHVENFGLNDRTVQSTGDKPYSAEPEYRRSIEFKPDIVIVILGTNDTKAINWHSEECFSSEYRALLNTWVNIENKPQVILCTPPWAMAPGNPIQRLTNDTDASMVPEIAEIVRKISREYSFPLIDLYMLFEGKRELLGVDRLHPNKLGAELIAEQVYSVIVKN